MSSSTRPLTARWVVVALTMLVVLVAAIGPVAAQEVPPGPVPEKEGRVGDAVVVDGGSERALAHGGSATKFSLQLPDDAACPGDSATGNWRVQSFLVPVTDDPGTLTYQSTKPVGEGRWALYPLDTRSYIDRLTAVASEDGGEGIIDERPVFTFVLFPPGSLPDGTYKVGFACTLWSETYRYWDTEIVITNTDSDEPAGLQWAVADGAAGTASSSSSSPRPAVIGLVVVIIIAAGLALVVVIRRGRRARPLVNSKEKR